VALSPQANAGLAAFLQSVGNSPLHQGLPAGTTPDSSWLTFLRSMGFTEAQAYQQASGAIDRAKRQVTMGVADVNTEGAEERRNISGNYEARGIFRSGERLADLARQRAAQTQKVGQLQTTGQDTIGGIRSTLSGQLSDLVRQRADQQLALQQRNEQRRLLMDPNAQLV
jgi:hypothetical protein